MEISPTQYANLIVKNIDDGHKKVGYMKITKSMLNGAKRILESSKEAEEEAKMELGKMISHRFNKRKSEQPEVVKRSKGRPKKYETEEERKTYKRVSSVNSANKTKLKKELDLIGSDYNLDTHPLDQVISILLEHPTQFSTKAVNLAKKIQPYVKEPKQIKEKPIKQPKEPKPPKQPRKKFETEEERLAYRKLSAKKSANKTKLKKLLKPYNIDIGKDGISINEAVSHIMEEPKKFNTGIVNLAKRIEVYLKPEKVGNGLPDFQDLNWGSLTKQFKAFKSSHPNINTLEKFAKYIIGNKDEFQEKTIKRANFYLNVILKGKGLDSSSSSSSSSSSDSSSDSSSSDGESSSDEGYTKKQRGEIDDYLLGFGINKILKNSIMPKFEKGSAEMKEHMAKLRAMKGKGVKGSKSKSHKGELNYTTKKSDKYYHRNHHLVEGNPYQEGGAVLLPTGHLANKLDLSAYMPRDFNRGLLSTSMMNVPMSRTPRVINAGGVKPPPMLNSSSQRYEGVDDSSRLGTAGNMSFHSLMSL